uniref:Uncharacterized protein n=1 Tax=Oryza rufipogon TaxID=4529 RepID=A0A0E0RAI1_ORYRU
MNPAIKDKAAVMGEKDKGAMADVVGEDEGVVDSKASGDSYHVLDDTCEISGARHQSVVTSGPIVHVPRLSSSAAVASSTVHTTMELVPGGRSSVIHTPRQARRRRPRPPSSTPHVGARRRQSRPLPSRRNSSPASLHIFSGGVLPDGAARRGSRGLLQRAPFSPFFLRCPNAAPQPHACARALGNEEEDDTVAGARNGIPLGLSFPS